MNASWEMKVQGFSASITINKFWKLAVHLGGYNGQCCSEYLKNSGHCNSSDVHFPYWNTCIWCLAPFLTPASCGCRLWEAVLMVQSNGFLARERSERSSQLAPPGTGERASGCDVISITVCASFPPSFSPFLHPCRYFLIFLRIDLICFHHKSETMSSDTC